MSDLKLAFGLFNTVEAKGDEKRKDAAKTLIKEAEERIKEKKIMPMTDQDKTDFNEMVNKFAAEFKFPGCN